QHCTAQKSAPYQLVFRQLPHCDTNLLNLLENDNYSYLSAKGSDSSLDGHTLRSEMDFQPTIISEINNEIENFEENYDDSDTILDVDDLQEMNSDADEWPEINNSADKQKNTNIIKIEDRLVNSNEIIVIEDSDDDFDESLRVELCTVVGSTKEYTE
ncbi:2556_t:CDS:2, partial [Gigaspora rosea]